MPIIFAENFEHDTSNTIARRYPGSVYATQSGTTVVSPAFPLDNGARLNFPSNPFGPSNNRFEVMLKTAGSQAGTVGLTFNLFGIPIVSGTTNVTVAGVSAPAFSTASTINIVLDRTAQGFSLIVLADGAAIIKPTAVQWTSVNNWIGGTSATASRYAGMPNWITGICVAVDTPVGTRLNNVQWRKRELTVAQVNGWEYTDVGYVEDLDKDDPSIGLPAIRSYTEGSSIEFDLDSTSDEISMLYGAAYSEESGQAIEIDGKAFPLSSDVLILPPLNTVGSKIQVSAGTPIGGYIGVPGTQGFGVGVCPDPTWLSELNLQGQPGTYIPAHEDYGNYRHANGGISVFVPKFFYRIGSPDSPRYAAYGLNAIDIVGIETFESELEANAAGYALHRAFIDDGKEKPGFFYDKYLASKDGTTSCKSVKNGHPISLATSSGYEPSSTMTGCTGILADSVVLARARGYGWNTVSLFMADAIATIAMAHGQATTSADFCAWYDATDTTNFPKGCNNNALGDFNDPTVTFQMAVATKPRTGSASNLAKTTHNGQPNGITDVNGAMYQVTIGLTQAGTSATSTTAVTTGQCYVLKTTAKHADLTGGWNGATDAWGNAGPLATRFDAINGFMPWGSTTGWVNFGNGNNQVFSGATSGVDYLRSCSGIQMATSSMSAEGTPLFGNDGCYQYGRQNLVPSVAGRWDGSGRAGVFCRTWGTYRSDANTAYGFRAAAYGS